MKYLFNDETYSLKNYKIAGFTAYIVAAAAPRHMIDLTSSELNAKRQRRFVDEVSRVYRRREACLLFRSSALRSCERANAVQISTVTFEEYSREQQNASNEE